MKSQCFSLISMLFITLQLTVNLFGLINGSTTKTCEILMSQTESIEGKSTTIMCTMPAEVKRISWNRKNVYTNKGDIFSSNKKIPRHSVTDDIDPPTRVDSKLIIDPVHREDGEYEYICRGECEKNDYISCKPTSILPIKEVPEEKYPICTIPKKSYQEGEVITISCRTEFLSHTVHLNISKGNRLIEDLTYTINGNEKVLEYKFSVTANNNYDSFVCTQTSDHVPDEKKNCKFPPLNVNYAPRVKISYSGKKHVQLGSEALLACIADSNPVNVQYSWNSTPYESKHNLETNGLVYRIKVDSLSQNGTVITCTARNAVGSGENNYTLIVVDNNEDHRPTKTDKPVNRNISNLNRGVTEDSEIKLLTIAGATLFLSALLIFILFCYLRQRHILYMQSRYIAQPEVYFEPKDSVRTQPPTSDGPYWGRNVGIQVPPDPDKDSEYAEIEEARKSGSNKSV